MKTTTQTGPQTPAMGVKNRLLLPMLVTALVLRPASQAPAQTFTTLYSFSATTPSDCLPNSDGAEPTAGLILSRNTLYGTASQGGDSGDGIVFAVNTDGTGFSPLYAFSAQSSFCGEGTNSDGASPNAVLLSGNTLYGTAQYGG